MARKKSLFGKTIDPACIYCSNGQPTQEKGMVLCKRNGPVSLYYSCKRFVYDPLKRVPKRQPKLPDFSAEDFAIE